MTRHAPLFNLVFPLLGSFLASQALAGGDVGAREAALRDPVRPDQAHYVDAAPVSQSVSLSPAQSDPSQPDLSAPELMQPEVVPQLDAAPDGAMADQASDLDALFEELQSPDLPNWEAVEAQIWTAWSRSGSPAMDLLLQRGREALAAEDFGAAIDHLSALTDHAPEFAEGWNARATAFFQIEEYGLSLADIERTLALNPRHFGALGGLAVILEQLDQPRTALEVYRAAHSIHPHRPNVEEAIERLQRELGDAQL